MPGSDRDNEHIRREPTISIPSSRFDHADDAGWFYIDRDVDHGPVTKTALMQVISGPPVRTDLLVWGPGLTGWTEAQHSGLLEVNGAASPSRSGARVALFSLQGRIRRVPFVLWAFLVAVLYAVVALVAIEWAGKDLDSTEGTLMQLGLLIPFLWPIFALASKRLHDLGMSGRHSLWILPAIWAPNLPTSPTSHVGLMIGSAVIELWLCCKRGQATANRFGPPSAGVTQPTVDAKLLQPVARRSRAWVWLGVPIAFVALVLAILGIIAVVDDQAPSCSDAAVLDKARQLVTRYAETEASVFLAGGIDNVLVTLEDVRTLSDSEPLNGRTCAAIAVLSAKPGALAKGRLGSKNVGYTVQNVDGNAGRFVVTLEP